MSRRTRLTESKLKRQPMYSSVPYMCELSSSLGEVWTNFEVFSDRKLSTTEKHFQDSYKPPCYDSFTYRVTIKKWSGKTTPKWRGRFICVRITGIFSIPLRSTMVHQVPFLFHPGILWSIRIGRVRKRKIITYKFNFII